MAARMSGVNSEKEAFLNKLPVFSVRNQRTNCSGFVSVPLRKGVVVSRIARKTLINQLGFVVGPNHARHFNESDEWEQHFL